MTKLILKKLGEIIGEYDLSKLRDTFTIGSDPYDNLTIMGEKIYKNHLRIERINRQYFVENLQSVTKVKINNQYINSKSQLFNGDQFVLGEHVLIFIDFASEDKEDMNDYGKTSIEIIKPELEPEKIKVSDKYVNDTTFNINNKEDEDEGNVDTDPQLIKSQDKEIIKADSSETIFPNYELVVIHGTYYGKRFKLLPKSTKIGREEKKNDIVIQHTNKGKIDHNISRRHATILARKDHYCLRDENSTNGTYLNKVLLRKSEEVELKDGDEIEIARYKQNTIFWFVSSGSQIKDQPGRHAVIKRQSYRASKTIILLSIILFIFSLIYSITSYTQLFTITKKPDPIKFSYNILRAEDIFGKHPKRNSNFYKLKQLMPTPVLASINENSQVTLILIDPEGYPMCLDLKKQKQVWENTKKGFSGTDHSVTLIDLFNDGRSEILLSGRDSRVYAFDCEYGNQIWKSDILGGKLSSQPSIGDLNSDGQNDFVVCSEDGTIYYGIAIAQNIVWKSLQIGHRTKAIPVIVDIDLDGQKEILIGTYDGFVLVFRLKDQELNQVKSFDIDDALNKALNSKNEDNAINNAIASGKLHPESEGIYLFITARRYRIVTYDPVESKLLWFEKLLNSGNQLPVYHSSSLISDINHDGNLDVIMNSTNGKIILYTPVKKEKQFDFHQKVWPANSEMRKQFVVTPALADLNKDGVLDVISFEHNGNLCLINGKTWNDLIDEQSTEEFNDSNKDSEPFTASPLVGDVNDNGYLDIVAVDNAYNIHIYKTNSKIFRDRIIWNQYAGAADHSCLFQNYPINIFNYYLKLYLSLFCCLIVLCYWFFSFKNRLK